MKLPHHLVESPLFLFRNSAELVAALGRNVSLGDIAEIDRLAKIGLPPIISRDALSAMLGVNPGLIWSFEKRPGRYYRQFQIPKGGGFRNITAPKVGLKILQKWLSIHFQNSFVPQPHVFGFVPGRSHLQAAAVHCGAHWVFSVDIRNFFPSTTVGLVENALARLGYSPESASFLTKFFCLAGGLAQGSPASPVLSNIAFVDVDTELAKIADHYNSRLSRYADDIVFSGTDEFPADLRVRIEQLFDGLSWNLAPEKTETALAPQRLKVHGLLVHGDHIRLTKGYRNRIRAYEHLTKTGKIRQDDQRRVKGHLMYAAQVSSS